MASASQSKGRGENSGIFLSFNQRDLGPTFLSRLCFPLKQQGIRTHLEKEDAASMRFKSIKIALVIFSKNYASSTWCWNELPNIMELNNLGELVVLPAFYWVDPADVRMPRKSFARAVAIHEKMFGKDSGKVKRWREALVEAASLPGCCLNYPGSEAELICSIIKHIHALLGREPSDVPRYLERDEPRKMNPAMAASSQSGGGQSSHIYLSFLRNDVCDSVLRDLHGALDPFPNKGNHTFVDVDFFLREEGINQLPMKDFKGSHIVIVVILSRNYAYSSLCMSKLVKILDHKKCGNLVVKPVFYDVDPEEVRAQTGGIRKALAFQEKWHPKKAKRWREALSEVGGLSGWHLINPLNAASPLISGRSCDWNPYNVVHDEAMLVNGIVKDVHAVLAHPPSDVLELRESKDSNPSSMASSSKYQGQGRSQVYVSFLGYDGSYNFLSRLNRELGRKGIWSYINLDRQQSMDFTQSHVEAIEDSQIAIVVFSRGFFHASQCRSELMKIMDYEDCGRLVVRLVFYKVDPMATIQMAASYLAFPRTANRWMQVLREAGRLFSWHLVDDRPKYYQPEIYISSSLEPGGMRKQGSQKLGEDFKDFVLEGLPLGIEIKFLQFAYMPHTFTEVPSLHLDDDRWSYDVFLSFRGPDTRSTITSHLYHALCQKGIHTFKDSPKLEAGQKRSELFEALKKSRIAIVMFSENYSRSKWCLEELRLIVKLNELDKLTIVPIFYRVTPEEVRLHGKANGDKGCYQIAMEEMEAKYGKNNPKMVENWKEALWKAGDLIGFPLPEGKDEGNCVEEVIEKVIKLLDRVPLDVAQCPIGMNARLKEFLPLLKLDAHLQVVRMVGIYGPGGVGKTTLSKAICNDIMQKFDGWCFLSEVRETPLIKLQKRLLRKLLSEKDLRVSSVDEGKTMIRQRLRDKRVLILIDDVDKPDQLDALAGGIDWFGEGSRIIITTRDSHVLDSSRIHCRHEVKFLVEAEAEYLFRYHASGGRPETLHIDPSLVDQFLVYAKGLPLALVVIGRSLCNRNTSDWESLHERLEQDPPQDIISTLKISFDGLDKKSQELFLDIACFFKGWDKDSAMKILSSCGFKESIDINILVERCLVTIEDGKLQMHNLLEAMGKSIAHGKCSEDDEIPNRIWSHDDFCDILSKNMAKERCATKGILLNAVIEDQEPLSSSTFEDFKKLRLLIVRKVLSLAGSLNFPSELRWFEWPKYSAPAIDFSSSRKLVGIDLQWSEITQILGKVFMELKYLNLYNCKSLEVLPNLSKSSQLEDLNLAGCQKLSSLDDSIGSLDKLVHLNLRDCCNITDVPSLLRSKNFLTINFSCCLRLDKFPAIKEELLFLKELNLERTSVKELPDSIGNLVAVKILNLSLCKELSVIPSSIFKLQALELLLASGCPKLETFPSKIRRDSMDGGGFPKLLVLNLQYCNLKEVEFLRDLTCFETLKEVYFSGNVFAQVPECIREFKNLEQLWLCCCKNLVELPEVPSAVELHTMGCPDLQSLSSLDAIVGGLKRSFHVNFSNCHSLDLHEIDTSLLKEIHGFGGSAEVIVARKEFPRWMDFQITDCDSNYMVPLPEGLLEDVILGLAISVTFSITRGRADSKSKQDFFPEVSLVVGKHKRFPRSDIDQFDGTHTWFLYIPRQPLSKHDSNYAADINWSDITLRFETLWTRIEICGVRVVCKNELDDQRFVVQKVEVKMDYRSESESESESESGQMEELTPGFNWINVLVKLLCLVCGRGIPGPVSRASQNNG